MKKLCFAVLLLTSMATYAQKWAAPGAKWTYSYSWMSLPTFFSLTVEKDTIINGVLCSKIPTFPTSYTYESNDTVFFFMQGGFRSTYYFNAQIGDTVTFFNNYISCMDGDSIILATIDSIDTIQLSNQVLKRFYSKPVLDPVGLTLFEPLPTYTEKLGSSSFLYPFFYRNCIVDQESYGLCGYSDNLISYSAGCISTISDEISKYELKVYPNPIEDYINVLSNKSGVFQFFNQLGQLIIAVPKEGGRLERLAVSGSNYSLANGVYTYIFEIDNSKNLRGKVIKN